MTIPKFIILFLFCANPWALAQNISELQFQSKFDQFNLIRSGKSYQFEGKPVQLGPFADLLPVFTAEIEGDCQKNTKPDVTVKAKIGNQWIERRFFIQAKRVSDGKNCGAVFGDGLVYIPLHRTWWNLDQKLDIQLQSSIKIVKDGQTLGEFVQIQDLWQSKNIESRSNVDFFATFRETLTHGRLGFYAHPSASDQKPHFTIHNGNQSIEFYKISNSLWMTMAPNKKWLVGSSDWSVWDNMDPSQWQDRNNGLLDSLLDSQVTVKERLQILRTLEGQWSPSLQNTLHRLLSDTNAPKDLRLETLKLMKQKPIKENLEICIRLLKESEDRDIIKQITMNLRTVNPKGLILDPEASENEVRNAILDWKKWWKQSFEKK